MHLYQSVTDYQSRTVEGVRDAKRIKQRGRGIQTNKYIIPGSNKFHDKKKKVKLSIQKDRMGIICMIGSMIWKDPRSG